MVSKLRREIHLRSSIILLASIYVVAMNSSDNHKHGHRAMPDHGVNVTTMTSTHPHKHATDRTARTLIIVSLILLIPLAVVTLVIELYTIRRRVETIDQVEVKSAMREADKHLRVDDSNFENASVGGLLNKELGPSILCLPEEDQIKMLGVILTKARRLKFEVQSQLVSLHNLLSASADQERSSSNKASLMNNSNKKMRKKSLSDTNWKGIRKPPYRALDKNGKEITIQVSPVPVPGFASKADNYLRDMNPNTLYTKVIDKPAFNKLGLDNRARTGSVKGDQPSNEIMAVNDSHRDRRSSSRARKKSETKRSRRRVNSHVSAAAADESNVKRLRIGRNAEQMTPAALYSKLLCNTDQ